MKIKKPVILILLLLHVATTRAQRFFYIDQNQLTANLLKGGLLNASQHITNSPLSSDYEVKTEVRFLADQNTLTLAMHLQDSVSFQTIFQVTETYTFLSLGPDTRRSLRTVIQAFIERNISQLVLSAKENHLDNRMNYLQARKDKT